MTTTTIPSYLAARHWGSGKVHLISAETPTIEVEVFGSAGEVVEPPLEVRAMCETTLTARDTGTVGGQVIIISHVRRKQLCRTCLRMADARGIELPESVVDR